ncbi:hypothetical protein HMPREF0556_10436 [Listeria grayi DSM 20601]|uniref:Uncharacterized protein n=1 Tax=Listeria grayi DSM 20601 TaxID=525367 RepID=D7UUD0_LISGR|nr:hypothetical protein HMPREF0556_10436 [Listeria grayi DSM 20601]
MVVALQNVVVYKNQSRIGLQKLYKVRKKNQEKDVLKEVNLNDRN